MKNLIVIGAGGFALEFIDLIESTNKINQEYKIFGFLDDNKTGTIIEDYKVIGTTEDILKFKNYYFVIAIANPAIKKKYFDILEKNKLKTPNIIHQLAVISNHSIIKENQGVIVNSGVTISAFANIGKCVIIDTGSYVGHEVKINDFVTIYSGAMIAGNAYIDKFTEIGMRSTIIQGLNIGINTVIGAGSVVLRNIEDNVVAVGNPCKVIKGR